MMALFTNIIDLLVAIATIVTVISLWFTHTDTWQTSLVFFMVLTSLRISFIKINI